MAHPNETTYTSKIRTIESRVQAIRQQIQAEEDSIAAAKQPVSLLQAFLSASVRQTALQEIYRSRGRIALLERDLVLAGYEKTELERLRTTFPEHDKLIERTERLRYRSWDLSLEEDELDLKDRKVHVAERLKEAQLLEDERKIEQEKEELAKKQRDLNRQHDELNKRQASFSKKKAARNASHP